MFCSCCHQPGLSIRSCGMPHHPCKVNEPFHERIVALAFLRTSGAVGRTWLPWFEPCRPAEKQKEQLFEDFKSYVCKELGTDRASTRFRNGPTPVKTLDALVEALRGKNKVVEVWDKHAVALVRANPNRYKPKAKTHA